jgi:hypothetical protein
VGLSRLRWGLAGAVALLALIATVSALQTYVAHQLTAGVLAVSALAITLLVGLASLASARRRIGAELEGLRRNPPGGALLAARRRRLQEIKAAGTRPDADALADAAAADEAGRAYIGRYLVATTVLIGLVGTFAGLMETLAKVAPLLGDNGSGGLAVLAGPLSGLHVTFGASLVAILATLSLALAQGDLALHETQALAALHDRTTHELIPALWPAAEEPAERTVRAVGELRTMLADAVGLALEKSARRITEGVRADGERSVKALEGTVTAVQQEVARLCSSVSAAVEEGARRQGQSLGQVSESAAKQAAAASEESVRRSTAVAAEAVRAISGQLAQTLAPLFTAEDARLEAVREGLARASTGVEQAATRLDAVVKVMEGISEAHTDAVERAARGVLASFDRAVLSGGAALGGAASSLAAAARDLREGAESFTPRLGELSTSLSGLGREVALLAARDPEGDLAAVVLGEVERLGAGVDRLTELLRMSGEDPVEPEPVAAEEPVAAAEEPVVAEEPVAASEEPASAAEGSAPATEPATEEEAPS